MANVETAEWGGSLRPTRHLSKPSQDTNASGIADSTISFSQFPPPPSSIPTTPTRSSFERSSPSRSAISIPVHPLVPRKGLPSESRDGSLRSQGTQRPSNTPRRPSSPQSLSPHDWHDGASSVDVDATEDRLLSTSFITSLLQENKERRRAQRTSYASDAISGISEMTYPPLASYTDADNASPHRPFPHRNIAQRPGVNRHPPTSFAPIAELTNRLSSDSETLHSNQGHPSVVKTASLSRNIRIRGASVVGVAPAILHNISGNSRPTSTQSGSTSAAPPYEKEGKYGSANETDYDSLFQYKTLHPPFSPALPSTAGTQRLHFKNSPQPHPAVRASVHSSKSVAPSFMSRISIPASLRRAFAWKRTKPLPPVPLIPHIPISVENQHRKADESTSLPDLVNRADTLHGLLEKGRHPHQSFNSYYELPKPAECSTFQDSRDSSRLASRQPLPKPLYHNEFGMPSQTSNQNQRRAQPPTFKFTLPRISKRLYFVIAFIVAAALAGIIAAALLTVKKGKNRSLTCPVNFAGTLCNLNATCVCTSPSQCNGLAQNLIDLIPIMNQAFTSNFTANDVYNSLWLSQGAPSGNTCGSQSILVDPGKALSQSIYPNRTQWTQAALLWNVVQSQDLQVSGQMQKFVQSAPWSKLGGADGPVSTNSGSSFSAIFAGYTYDFAAQTVTQPAASFVTLGQPTNAQIARVGPNAHVALDRMYTFAQASSLQRSNALRNYWTTSLSQQAGDLSVFKAALSVAPILLPFNATSQSIQSLYSNSSSSMFPPPIACYPGLNSQQVERVNSLETTVFGLQTASIAAAFNASCYPDRPIYGILDVLRLRLPFIDSRTGLSLQAAELSHDAVPRAVVYVGEMLSTLPNLSPATNFTSTQLDQRRFGTLSLSDHVLIEYLSSIPIDTATALVKFVLNTVSKPAIPPDNSSSLLQALPSIPTLEVAIFGSIGPPDVSSTVSAFTTSSGSLFFGSDSGSAFRNWAITAYGRTIIWSETAVSSQIVRDNSLSDATINGTWNAISIALRNNIPGIGLANITDTFQRTQKFTST